MKNTKAMTALLLSALCLAGTVLSACGDSGAAGGSTPSTEPAENGTAATEAVPEDLSIEKDGVPEIDFGGTSLRMAGQANHITNDMDMWIEEQTGDVVRDAIWQRNAAMEERFNVKIEKPLMDDYNNVSSAVKNTVRAGDDAYEIVINQLATTSADVLNGYFMNLNDIPYIDFSRNWYPASVVESATLDDQLYLIVSDMCLTYVGQTWSMCFNKDLTTELDIENLYDLVRSGQWTLGKLLELSKDIYVDLNGNGQRDEEDRYGFTMGKSMNGCMASALLYGAGQRFFDIAADHSIVNLLGSEHAQAAAQKFYDLNTSAGSANYAPPGTGNPLDSIMATYAVFAPAQLGHYYSYARDFNGTFGVLPLPKFDEAQASYATLCDAGCNCISVPETCGNTELAGAMIEAMSAYSHNYVLPAYVNLALETKVARDEESVEMMQIVLNSRVMDFGYLYCGWTGWTWQLEGLLKDAGKYMSSFEKKQSAMDKYYQKVIAVFEEEK